MSEIKDDNVVIVTDGAHINFIVLFLKETS